MAIKNIATHVNDGGGYNVSGNDKRPVANVPGAKVSAVEDAWDRGERYNGVGSNPLNTGIGAGAGAVAPIVANPPANNNIGSAVEPVVPTTPTVPVVPTTPTTPTVPTTPTTPAPAPTVPTTPSVPPTSEVVPGGTVVGGGVDGAIYSNGAVDIVPSGGGGYGGGGAVDSRYEAPQLVSATDQSDYIRAMYEAQRDARLAALETAYNQSLAALEKQAATIPQYYYEAGRQTAGLNAREVQAMNERFNAAGLNTGASGQGALAQNAVFQGNMAGIRQAEANALAEVEADRAALAMQYQNEIKEAILNNESEKAAALYAEMIRVDESIVDTAYRQAGIDMTAQEFQFGVDKYNQGRADEKAADEEAKLEERAAALASIGDFSLYKYLGYTDDEIAKISAAWQTANAPTGGGTYTPTSNLTFSRAKELADSGYIDADVAAALMKGGYSAGALQTLYGYTVPTQNPGGSYTDSPALTSPRAQEIWDAYSTGAKTAQQSTYFVESALNNGRITEAEADAILSAMGY